MSPRDGWVNIFIPNWNDSFKVSITYAEEVPHFYDGTDLRPSIIYKIGKDCCLNI